jgi:hypothetical protein
MGEGSVDAALLDSFVTLHVLMALAQLSPDMGDKFTWKFSNNGIYSAYRLQFAGAIDFPFVPPHLETRGHAAMTFFRLAFCPEPFDDGQQITYSGVAQWLHLPPLHAKLGN